MAGLMDDLMGQLGAAGGDAGVGGLLGGLLGADDGAKTEAATNMGIGAILEGLSKNSQSRGGAKSLDKALQKHDGSILDDLPGQLGSTARSADGAKIISHVFGKNETAVAQGVADKSGLDLGSVKKLLPMLAPVVMGMLAKKRGGGGAKGGTDLGALLGAASGGLDLGDIAGMLGGGTGAGGLMGMLKGMLGGR